MSEELEKKMAEVWRNVAGTDFVPQPPSQPFPKGEAHVETVKFLKNTYSRAEADWRRLLETKDANLRALAIQLEESNRQIDDLKRLYDESREAYMGLELSKALMQDETAKILDAQKKSHARELLLLKELLERSKTEMVSLSARIETIREERDVMRRKMTETGVTAADFKDKAEGLEQKIADAKEAVEKTLSELLSERKARQEADKKTREAEKKIADLDSQLANAKLNWDAERKEWRELWDRERSVWETHRQEFAVWETRLRSEREAWSFKIKEEENKGVENAAALNKILKESSEWSEKVTQVLKLYALKGVQLPQVFVRSTDPGSPLSALGTVKAAKRRSLARMAAITLASMLALGSVAWRIHAYRSIVHFSSLSRYSLDTPNASGLSFSKDGIWLADWEKGLVLKDLKDFSTLRIIKGGDTEPFKPASVSAFEGGVWTLDMAQLRFIKKSLPDGATLEIVKTPGPAPQGIAWDKYNLWSYDAATARIYRYSLDPAAGIEASYELPGLKNLSAMQWVGRELWTVDSDAFYRRYSIKNDKFVILSEQKLKKPLVSFWADASNMWTLERNTTGTALELKKYKYKLYL